MKTEKQLMREYRRPIRSSPQPPATFNAQLASSDEITRLSTENGRLESLILTWHNGSIIDNVALSEEATRIATRRSLNGA